MIAAYAFGRLGLSTHDRPELAYGPPHAMRKGAATGHDATAAAFGLSEASARTVEGFAIGHGEAQSVLSPARIRGLVVNPSSEVVLEIAAGHQHSLVRLEGRDRGESYGGRHELRAFGCNDDGQLGLPSPAPWPYDEGDRNTPTLVEHLYKVKAEEQALLDANKQLVPAPLHWPPERAIGDTSWYPVSRH